MQHTSWKNLKKIILFSLIILIMGNYLWFQIKTVFYINNTAITRTNSNKINNTAIIRTNSNNIDNNNNNDNDNANHNNKSKENNSSNDTKNNKNEFQTANLPETMTNASTYNHIGDLRGEDKEKYVFENMTNNDLGNTRLKASTTTNGYDLNNKTTMPQRHNHFKEALSMLQEPVFVVYGNRGYNRILGNFLCNMALFPPMHQHILVIVTDKETDVYLQSLSKDITTIVLTSSDDDGENNLLLHEAYDFESSEYLQIMLARGFVLIDLLKETIEQQKTLIWLEPDFHYTQNLLQRNEMIETRSDLVFFWDQEMYCGCFIRFAPVPASLIFYTEVMHRMRAIHSAGGTTNDQILLNHVVNELHPNFTVFDRCLYRSGTFNTGGYMLEYQRACTGIQPVAQHHNWIVGAANKIQMAKNKGGWFLSDDEKSCSNFTNPLAL